MSNPLKLAILGLAAPIAEPAWGMGRSPHVITSSLPCTRSARREAPGFRGGQAQLSRGPGSSEADARATPRTSAKALTVLCPASAQTVPGGHDTMTHFHRRGSGMANGHAHAVSSPFLDPVSFLNDVGSRATGPFPVVLPPNGTVRSDGQRGICL